MKQRVVPEREDLFRIHFLMEAGNPTEEIVMVAERHCVDVVVMGHHARRSAIELGVLESVAARVLAESSCPVMVLRD